MYTFDDNILVFSSERGLFDSALDLLTGEETASIADKPIRRELERFRTERACAWGFSRGGLVKGEATDLALLRMLGDAASTEPSPLFFSLTWEDDSLRLTAARDTGGGFTRSPPPAPRIEYADRLLLWAYVSADLLTAIDRKTEPLFYLFPSGCSATLLPGDIPGAAHPAVWGAAGPDAESILRTALEDSGTPASQHLVDDVLITSTNSEGDSITYALVDDLLILGRNAEDIIAHQRFIRDSAFDPYSSPEIKAFVHLIPSALIDATDSEDAFMPLLSGCGLSDLDGKGSKTPSYRELAEGLTAWETADMVTWTDGGQTNLTVILTWAGEQP